MKPKNQKFGNTTSSVPSRVNSVNSSKRSTQNTSPSKSTVRPRTALDNIQRKSSTRRISNFIDEKNKALNSLQDIENKYGELFSVLSDGVLIFDAESKQIFEANDSACKLFGYGKIEMAQLTIPELSGEPDQTIEQLSKVIHEELKKIPFSYIKTKSGSRIPTEITTGKFQVKKKSYVFAIYRDITQEVKNQEAIKKKSIALEKSNQALKDFVSIASHDLQAPARKIVSFSSRLKEMKLELDQEPREYLDRMEKIAIRMQVLLDDLLDFSKVSDQTNTFQKTDLKIILKEVLEDLPLPHQELHERIEIGSLPLIEANAPQMRQLFQNLISNSIKFHKQGMLPKIKIYGKPVPKKCWKIFIEDQGIGFDEKYLDRIFKPFERLHGVDSFEGTGMGLAICKKIVESHNGTITAKSQPDQGACFLFTLPEKRLPKRY